MVNSKDVIALAISALIVIIILAVAPMIGSNIDDTYDVTDTSSDGWNVTANSDLDSPATTWVTFVGLITLGFLAVIIGIVIRGFKDMGND